MLLDRHPELVRKGMKHNFSAWGYFATTVGNVNEATIKAYIRDLEEADKLEDK